MEADNEICEINECHHIYHVQCLQQWLEQKNECPLCKKKVDCYRENIGLVDEGGARILINQLVDLHQPMEAYFRELVDLQNDMAALQNFQRARRANLRRDRDYALGILALNTQLRQIQANLIMNRVNMQVQLREFI